MVDSATGYGTDGFYKAKGSFIEPACMQLQKWKNDGKEVKIIQQDNAGKNKLFEDRAGGTDWKLVGNLNILLGQHHSIIVLLNWLLLHALDWLKQCLMMPIWKLKNGPNWQKSV